jgi:hypothetical protein
MNTIYRAAAPDVVADVIDGEAVIMNLRTGRYFSSLGAGAGCWEAIAAGHSPELVAGALAASYGLNPGAALEEVQRFVHELTENGLIVPMEGPGPDASPTWAVAEEPFRALSLNVYTDMQDLLLLDPIHDVDAAGWPMPKNEASV